MDIKCFRQKIDKEDAIKSAWIQGGFFGKIMCFNKEVSEVRLHYIENKFITYEVTYKPSILEKLIHKKSSIKKQKILMIADGSIGSIAAVDSLPEVVSASDVDENSIQFSSYNDDELIKRGKKTAVRVIHKHIGSIPEVELIKIESIFRPYWIVMYGDLKKGNKVRYIPVPADGCGAYRTF